MQFFRGAYNPQAEDPIVKLAKEANSIVKDKYIITDTSLQGATETDENAPEINPAFKP